MNALHPDDNLQRLYIGDYFSDTLEFSAEQHAVFQRLLLYLWLEDPSILQERRLRKHASLSRSDWRGLRVLLMPLLEVALKGIAQWKKAVTAYDGQRLPPFEWQMLRAIVLARDGYVCTYCGSGDALHVDHCIPISRGGTNAIHNLATACAPCNQSKGPKPLEVWRLDRPGNTTA